MILSKFSMGDGPYIKIKMRRKVCKGRETGHIRQIPLQNNKAVAFATAFVY